MKAVVILYEGRELPFELEGEIAALLSRIGVAGDTVHISKATDAEVEEFVAKGMIPECFNKITTDCVDEKIVASVDYLNGRYKNLIGEDTVKLAIQIISDINAGNAEAEMLKSCITTVVKCPKPIRVYKIPKDLFSTIKLIYNNHLV